MWALHSSNTAGPGIPPLQTEGTAFMAALMLWVEIWWSLITPLIRKSQKGTPNLSVSAVISFFSSVISNDVSKRWRNAGIPEIAHYCCDSPKEAGCRCLKALGFAVLSLCQPLGWARSPTRLEHFAQLVQEVKAQGQMLTQILGLPEPLPPRQLKTSSTQNRNKKNP